MKCGCSYKVFLWLSQLQWIIYPIFKKQIVEGRPWLYRIFRRVVRWFCCKSLYCLNKDIYIYIYELCNSIVPDPNKLGNSRSEAIAEAKTSPKSEFAFFKSLWQFFQLTMPNVGELSWSGIPMNHIQVQKEKENFTSSIKRETRYFHVVVVK